MTNKKVLEKVLEAIALVLFVVFSVCSVGGVLCSAIGAIAVGNIMFYGLIASVLGLIVVVCGFLAIEL